MICLGLEGGEEGVEPVFGNVFSRRNRCHFERFAGESNTAECCVIRSTFESTLCLHFYKNSIKNDLYRISLLTCSAAHMQLLLI